MANASQAIDAGAPSGASVRLKISREDWIMRGVLAVIALYLFVAIVMPLFSLLSRGLLDRDGNFIGFANFAEFFSTPALFISIQNSFTVTLICTLIVVTLAFIYAYALTRSCMPFKPLFKGIAMVPILMPSLLPAISLVYLFGNEERYQASLEGHKAALWIRSNTDPDVVIGCWDAGKVGYFSDRKVVNLDGVISSFEFVEDYLLKDRIGNWLRKTR